MTTSTLTDCLAFYAAHKAALFPIPAGSKAPTGIVASFKHDHSSDPKQWEAWSLDNPNCNFGVVAFASRWLVMDTDAKEDRNEAWALRCSLLKEWGMDPATLPHVQSVSGGWHDYFALPPDVDPTTLRQPDAIKKRINIRAIGYTVAAGSQIAGVPYTLLSDAPPHPAPAALISHCTRAAAPSAPIVRTGHRDPGETAAFLKWMVERDVFAPYEDWCGIGMALKIEFGDAGFDLWSLTHDETVTPDIAQSKWASFAAEPEPGCVTLQSFLKRANDLGWRGQLRPSAAAMFDGVAQIAAAAGASLSSGQPLPMLAGQVELCRLGEPILTEFLTATKDAPLRPANPDVPTLPASMESHGLYTAINAAIVRIMALAESPKLWKPARVKSALAVLLLAHQDVFESVRRRVEGMGRTLPLAGIKIEAKGIEDQIQRVFVPQDDWIYDARSGLPESDNPDNIAVFLALIGAEIRWNAWLNRAEIKGFEWPNWQAVDDVVIAKLKVRALRTKTRFRVANEFLKDTLLALSHNNQHDPVLERINSLQWDGQPRLAIWLSQVCGVPCDLYHQAVGKNVIGGMVRRVRHPGTKHDEVMILMGPQGTLKSTLCRALALDDAWFTDSVTFEGSPQNIVPQLFGKMVVELSELDGMHKKEVQSIKRFISAQSDNVTLKYKAFASDFARRCVFIGTSNEDSPLVDITGNRRFLPVHVSNEANLGWLRENIEQLFAEAAALEAHGADFTIPRNVWAIAAVHQEAARSVSDVEVRLQDWFGETEYTRTAFIAKADLIELCDIAGWRGVHALRNQVMKKLGFHEAQPYIKGIRTRGWLRSPIPLLASHIEERATRYIVNKMPDGRPRVSIRQPLAA